MHSARRMSFFFFILEQINTDRIPKAKKYFVNVHLLYTFLKKILVGNYIYMYHIGVGLFTYFVIREQIILGALALY